jgi:hypothetical protein
MEDARLLSLVSLADAALSQSAALETALARGRLELAFSKLRWGGGASAAGAPAGAALALVPAALSPTRRLPTGFPLAEEAEAADYAAAGAGAGLRRRRQRPDGGAPDGEGAAAADGAAARSGEAGDDGDDPLAWFGPNAASGLGTAQALFVEALRAATALAAVRARLAAAMDAGGAGGAGGGGGGGGSAAQEAALHSDPGETTA